MKHIIFLFFLLFISVNFLKAQGINKVVYDTLAKKEIILGEVDRIGLSSFGDWFNNEYNSYTPDSSIISQLKNYKDDYPWVFIALGTWCSDTREQVPRLYKILDIIDYPSERIFAVGLDKAKKAGNFCIADFKIEFVPTIIFTYKAYDIGKITEQPIETLEKDILNFFKSIKK